MAEYGKTCWPHRIQEVISQRESSATAFGGSELEGILKRKKEGRTNEREQPERERGGEQQKRSLGE